jgi:hypothetical protein
MRTGLFICAAWLAAAASLLADQEKRKDHTEKTIITVIGCVDGSWLRVRSADPVGSYTQRYKLVGPKQLLKEISSQYKGHLIEVTGPVTDTAATTHRGKTIQVGKKTRITTLAKEGPAIPTGNEPTLGVDAYRQLKDSCS